MSLSDRLATQKETAIKEINKSAARFAEASSVEDRIKTLRGFKDCVQENYMHYLLAVKYKKETVSDLNHGDAEKFSDEYFSVISDERRMLSLLENYNPNQGDFFNYFEATMAYNRKHAVNEEHYQKCRAGITEVFTKLEVQALYRWLKFSEFENLSAEGDTELIAAWCNENAHDPQKMLLLLQKRDVVNVLPLTTYDSESGEEFERKGLQSYDAYFQNEEGEFKRLLLKLNELYKTSFSENQRLIFPKTFTSEYISDCVDEVKTKFKVSNREVTIKNHWEDLQLENLRDEYAIELYLCISCEIFDYVIKFRSLLSKKNIAEKLGFSPAYISKTHTAVIQLIKRSD